MAFQDLFKFQDYKSMLSLNLQIPQKQKSQHRLYNPTRQNATPNHVRNSRPRPTSRGRRRAATHELGAAQQPPPDAPPQGQRHLHLVTKINGSNTTVWQVINLDMNIN